MSNLFHARDIRLPAYREIRERYKSRDGKIPEWHLTAQCPGCGHSIHEIDKCMMFNIADGLFCDCTYNTQSWEFWPYTISEIP